MSETITDGGVRGRLNAFWSTHPYVLLFVGAELAIVVLGVAVDVAAGPAATVYTHRAVLNVLAGILSAFVLLTGIVGVVVAVTYYAFFRFTSLY